MGFGPTLDTPGTTFLYSIADNAAALDEPLQFSIDHAYRSDKR